MSRYIMTASEIGQLFVNKSRYKVWAPRESNLGMTGGRAEPKLTSYQPSLLEAVQNLYLYTKRFSFDSFSRITFFDNL